MAGFQYPAEEEGRIQGYDIALMEEFITGENHPPVWRMLLWACLRLAVVLVVAWLEPVRATALLVAYIAWKTHGVRSRHDPVLVATRHLAEFRHFVESQQRHGLDKGR